MNILNVSLQHSILTLAAHGWSHRRIARELDLNRETMGWYLATGPGQNLLFQPRLNGGSAKSLPVVAAAE
jgi:orotate phosphoribosyltransferase-like protein